MMRRLIVAASMLACAVAAQPRIAAALNIMNGGGGGQMALPAQTIASVNLSPTTFIAATPDAVVGAVSVTMSPASPPFSGSLSITGTNTGGFHLVGTTLEARTVGGTAAGTYADFTIVAQQGGISNQVAPSVTNSDVVVTAQSGAVQQFGGMGFAWMPPVNGDYAQDPIVIPTDAWTEIFRRLFLPGHFTWTRFYRDNAFSNQPDIGLLNIAKAQGMKDSVTIAEWCKTNDDAVDADNDAAVVQNIRNAGIPMTAISLANKYNAVNYDKDGSGNPCKVITNVNSRIRALRSALDARGQNSVIILAPETVEWTPFPAVQAVRDHYTFQPGDTDLYFNTVTNDAPTLAALGAYDLHSYGTAVTTALQNLASSHGKPFWVSMNSRPFYDDFHYYTPGNAVSAADFLSDMNHGVTKWAYWTWFDFITVQGLPQSAGAVQTSELYDTMSVLTGVFDLNAFFRQSVSYPALPTADMHYQYLQEPQITAAIAKNPNSSWGIGLVNLTGVQTDVVQNPQTFTPGGGQDMTVQVCIQELAGAGPLTFHKKVNVAGPAGGVTVGTDAAMTNGCLITVVHQLETVSLINRERRVGED